MAELTSLCVALLVAIGLTNGHMTSTSTVDPPYYSEHEDVSNSSLIHGSNLQLERYRARVRVLHTILRSECKDIPSASRMRRDLSLDLDPIKQEVEMILYERMIRMLAECRRRKEVTTSSPSTTRSPQPSECQSAQNLSEFWRQDHNGSNYKPGGRWNCDWFPMVSAGRPWFRFTGSAGNMMLNRCPLQYSCGTQAGVWTDAEMPSDVGVVSHVNIYGSYSGNCKRSTGTVDVMRCSDDVPNDFVYKFTGSSACNCGFCGMYKLN